MYSQSNKVKTDKAHFGVEDVISCALKNFRLRSQAFNGQRVASIRAHFLPPETLFFSCITVYRYQYMFAETLA
jgi:hypothetical protein